MLVKKPIEAAAMKYRRRRNAVIRPLFINFPVTYRCNMRCSMCDIWQRYRKAPQKASEELTTDDIRRIFSENRNFLSKVKNVGLTGGEPFLRDDIVDIVRIIHENVPKARLGAQTNGFNTKSIIKSLKEILEFCPEFGLAVSLDGVADTHDKIRGIRGTFNNALKTIKEAHELGVKRITTGMTLSCINYNQISKVKGIAEGLDTEFSCFLADEGDYFDNLGGGSGALTQEMKKSIINDLKQFSHNYYMDNLRRQMEGEKRKLPCYSGFTSFVIDPYGELRPCIILPDSFGNLKDNRMEDLLKTEKARQIRDKVKGCTCWNQCEASTSALVDVFDVMRWFLRSGNRRKFLKEVREKDIVTR
jgi:MoaA/NifB/PqqE/SkfB family radical SAM enzyme